MWEQVKDRRMLMEVHLRCAVFLLICTHSSRQLRVPETSLTFYLKSKYCVFGFKVVQTATVVEVKITMEVFILKPGPVSRFFSFLLQH